MGMNSTGERANVRLRWDAMELNAMEWAVVRYGVQTVFVKSLI